VKFSPEVENKLLDLIAEGVYTSAATLADVSHTTWSAQTGSISTEDAGSLKSVEARLAEDKTEHYGAYLSMPGAVFLLMLPKKDAPDLSKAFLGGRRSGTSAPPDAVCIAEIANIIINTIASTLADACDDSFILTAPTMILGNKTVLMKLAAEKLATEGEPAAIMTFISMASQTLASDCTVLLMLSPSVQNRIMEALDR
jgi:chemotaxis protein CheY-P-specific phosphatase CheC